MLSDATSILENKFEHPDLIILDRLISGQDGLTVCSFLKNQNSTKNIKVIVASATPNIKHFSINAGADAAIEKPFQVQELLNLVEKLI